MKSFVDQVIWHGELHGTRPITETSIVMTRQIRWLFINRSRTTVMPGEDCEWTPGFIVWWNNDDPTVLQLVHSCMVETIQRIGFSMPAVWCNRRHLNKNPRSLEYFWKDQLGDVFAYYRKAT